MIIAQADGLELTTCFYASFSRLLLNFLAWAVNSFSVFASPLNILAFIASETGEIQSHEVLGKLSVLGKHVDIGVSVEAEDMILDIPFIGPNAITDFVAIGI